MSFRMYGMMYGIWMICMLVFVACSGTINRYHPSERLPQRIYFGDELNLVKDEKDLSNERLIYTEIRTREGEERTGKLIRITESDLVLSEGYYYRSVDDTLSRVENRKVIPRADILLLKVW
jgi:hypothetical protein